MSRGKSKILAGDSTIATRRERRRSGVGGDPARNGNSGSTRLDSTRAEGGGEGGVGEKRRGWERRREIESARASREKRRRRRRKAVERRYGEESGERVVGPAGQSCCGGNRGRVVRFSRSHPPPRPTSCCQTTPVEHHPLPTRLSGRVSQFQLRGEWSGDLGSRTLDHPPRS